MTGNSVPVPVTVALHPDVYERLNGADPDLAQCGTVLTAGLSRLVADLGLSAELTVSVSVAEDPDPEYPITVTVTGSPSRSVRGVAAQPLYWAGAAGLSLGLPLPPGADLPGILRTASDSRLAGRVLAAAVTEAVRRDAELLLTPPVIELWAASAGLPAGWDPAAVLHELLNLGLPPGDGAEVSRELAGHPAGSVAGLEAAVAARALGAWEIVVSLPSLREITADAVQNPDRFQRLRDRFANDSGVPFPRVVLSGGATSLGAEVVVRMFGVTGPSVLLHPAASAEPGAAPPTAAGQPAAEVIVSALAALAKDRIGALVTTTSTGRLLDQLGRSFPKLHGLTAAIGLEAMTRLLRALAAEGVSIRNLPPIVQAVTDYAERSGLPPDQAELLHYVRLRIAQTITRAAAAGADHLVATRVPSQLENVTSPAVAAGLMDLAAQVTASGQHGGILVASARARAGMHAALMAEYPMLTVLGEDELTGTPLQPTAVYSVPAGSSGR